jgi:hypothetical protein
VSGKKGVNGNGDKGQTHYGSADLDRAIFSMGPSKTTSFGSGDFERLAEKAERISKVGD